MTYCVALRLDRGLLFMSDTRTNAGVDNISVFPKMFSWEVPGERVITMLTAGNLGTTQSVISLLDERTKAPEERNPSILEAPSMFKVAQIVAATLKDTVAEHDGGGQSADAFGGTIILGGQIKGAEPRLFLIYPEGNFIEACDETPFFQIGETKYGRPILVRAFDPSLSFEDAIKLLYVSFDSTIQANLSVGPPIDVQVVENDSCRITSQFRVDGDDETFAAVTAGWGAAMRDAFAGLPSVTVPPLGSS